MKKLGIKRLISLILGGLLVPVWCFAISQADTMATNSKANHGQPYVLFSQKSPDGETTAIKVLYEGVANAEVIATDAASYTWKRSNGRLLIAYTVAVNAPEAGTLKVIDLNKNIIFSSKGLKVDNYSWSPDHSRIAFCSGDTVYVLSLDKPAPQKLCSLGFGVTCEWSPNGRHLILWVPPPKDREEKPTPSMRGTLFLISAESGSTPLKLADSLTEPKVKWNEANGSLAVLVTPMKANEKKGQEEESGRLTVVNLDGSERKIAEPKEDVGDFGWAGKGRYLYYIADSVVTVLDTKGWHSVDLVSRGAPKKKKATVSVQILGEDERCIIWNDKRGAGLFDTRTAKAFGLPPGSEDIGVITRQEGTDGLLVFRCGTRLHVLNIENGLEETADVPKLKSQLYLLPEARVVFYIDKDGGDLRVCAHKLASVSPLFQSATTHRFPELLFLKIMPISPPVLFGASNKNIEVWIIESDGTCRSVFRQELKVGWTESYSFLLPLPVSEPLSQPVCFGLVFKPSAIYSEPLPLPQECSILFSFPALILEKLGKGFVMSVSIKAPDGGAQHWLVSDTGPCEVLNGPKEVAGLASLVVPGKHCVLFTGVVPSLTWGGGRTQIREGNISIIVLGEPPLEEGTYQGAINSISLGPPPVMRLWLASLAGGSAIALPDGVNQFDLLY